MKEMIVKWFADTDKKGDAWIDRRLPWLSGANRFCNRHKRIVTAIFFCTILFAAFTCLLRLPHSNGY